MIGLLLQYVLSGSDDFNLYVWKVPEEPIDGLYTDVANVSLLFCESQKFFGVEEIWPSLKRELVEQL